jgi:hypothetical protein
MNGINGVTQRRKGRKGGIEHRITLESGWADREWVADEDLWLDCGPVAGMLFVTPHALARAMERWRCFAVSRCLEMVREKLTGALCVDGTKWVAGTLVFVVVKRTVVTCYRREFQPRRRRKGRHAL